MKRLFYIFLLMAFLFLGTKTIVHYTHWLKESVSFRVRRVHANGNSHVSKNEILKRAHIPLSKKIWSIDLQQVEMNILENRFLKSVCVFRVFPDAIHIEIEEKKPIALLKVYGSLYVLDEEGVLLPSSPQYYDLPVVSGPVRSSLQIGWPVNSVEIQNAIHFLRFVMEERPRLYADISEVITGKKEGLCVYLSSVRTLVKIGEGEFERKVPYLDAVLEEIQRDSFINEVKYLDLRFQGQVIVGFGV